VVEISKSTTGELDVDGEKIAYTFMRAYRLPHSKEWNSTIEADYNGLHIQIDDHGIGLEYAKILLRHGIRLKKDLNNP
jgi:hypothetical protein